MRGALLRPTIRRIEESEGFEKIVCAAVQEARRRRAVAWRAMVLVVLVGLVGLVAGLTVLPKAAHAERFVVGPEGAPAALADVVSRAADGDTIEMIEGTYRGLLVIDNKRLTFRGMGEKVLVQAEPKPSAAKGLWTIKSGEVTIENLEFRGMRSEDGSGAALRLEGGKLTVRGSRFFDNEHGLLATNDDKAQIVIEGSVFGQAPKVVGGLYHLINIGRIARLDITGTRFQQGFEGHLIKSRARETRLAYNFIHDGVRGGASYEIEIAQGGIATIVGNVIGQGADSQNRVLLSYGSEGRGWDKNQLLVAHNTFVSYGWLPAWFMRVHDDRLPSGLEVVAVNNLLVGAGVFSLGNLGRFEGNRMALAGMLRDIDTYAFELPANSTWRGAGIDPRNVAGHDLSPKAEFEWKGGTKALPRVPERWTPGAFQR